MVDDAEGHRESKEACSALATVAPGRDVHCTKAAGHSPAETSTKACCVRRCPTAERWQPPLCEHVPHHRVRPREPWAFDLKFTETTTLPYDHLDRATAGLRAELSKKVAAVQAGEPDWATLASERSAGNNRGSPWLTVAIGTGGGAPLVPMTPCGVERCRSTSRESVEIGHRATATPWRRPH
jgi:hypothetical protein